ncbi:Gfo/Idh/MocA family protein [Allonocardiopsis opalescens]|uniref:Myo-inositol 2-dehydrogenase/D-chiro-inositol 1-dehydrogenase n=1 Tax=Allonocardiopsis opalescens TaxID=1144618 RepID=A0A2T0PVP2_9ACTN|nr:Gfo/Idh/MocA family oxidoreductase [Allonocardiopsis opalescens]PRX95428.1 myo-inositol 2-dehydrogenase/D-chiro-inositol 1-dehydrogenase [Allonocardiopsis opalescens]
MRIGLAGVGRIGRLHAATLSGLAPVESLVLADIDPDRAASAAAELRAEGAQVEAVEGPDDLFGAGIDGLVIATATDAHAPLIVRSAADGVPVLCEKPVAVDIEQTRSVVRRLETATTPVVIGFQRRFDTGYRAARAAVAGGGLGWLHTVRATTLDASPPPAGYVPGSGGLLRDCSIHDFDIIRWTTGREAVEVHAIGANRGADYFAAAGDVDTAITVLRLDDDTLATASATRYNGGGHDVRLELLGSDDSIAVGLDGRLPLRSVQPGVPAPEGPVYQSFMERFRGAYVAELTAFAELVAGKGDGADLATVHDALQAARIAEAASLSRVQGRPVRLADIP